MIGQSEGHSFTVSLWIGGDLTIHENWLLDSTILEVTKLDIPEICLPLIVAEINET